MEKRIASITKLKPFPEVTMVPRLMQPGWAAQYRQRLRRIELGEVLREMAPRARQYAIYHEIGHWVRVEHLPSSLDEETFARAFAIYMLANKRDDRLVDVMRSIINGHETRLRVFARRCEKLLAS
jgi:hypothetical protein